MISLQRCAVDRMHNRKILQKTGPRQHTGKSGSLVCPQQSAGKVWTPLASGKWNQHKTLAVPSQSVTSPTEQSGTMEQMEPGSSQHQDGKTYEWTKAWYPVRVNEKARGTAVC